MVGYLLALDSGTYMIKEAPGGGSVIADAPGLSAYQGAFESVGGTLSGGVWTFPRRPEAIGSALARACSEPAPAPAAVASRGSRASRDSPAA
jgi:hypothetical protein